MKKVFLAVVCLIAVGSSVKGYAQAAGGGVRGFYFQSHGGPKLIAQGGSGGVRGRKTRNAGEKGIKGISRDGVKPMIAQGSSGPKNQSASGGVRGKSTSKPAKLQLLAQGQGGPKFITQSNGSGPKTLVQSGSGPKRQGMANGGKGGKKSSGDGGRPKSAAFEKESVRPLAS